MAPRNNFYIPAPYIEVLDVNRSSLGTMPAGKAKDLANTRALYLLPYDSTKNPPVYALSETMRLEENTGDGITSDTVRLLSQSKEMLGVMSAAEARKAALDAGTGIIVLNAKQDPNICMLGDPKKYEYDRKKAEKENAKKQKAISRASEVKELKFPADTSDSSKGDRDRLLSRAAEFIAEGHPVKVSVKFRGRQMSHANDVMDRIMDEVRTLENCTIGNVSNSGNIFSVLCTPVKRK